MNGISGPQNILTNILLFTGSANAQLLSTTIPTTIETTTQPYAVPTTVPDETTAVHYNQDQPSDSMPEPTSFNISSNFSQLVDCVGGLCKNLAGHGVGHGVTGCSHSSVAGHQQPESANLSILRSLNSSEQCSQH